MILPNRIFFTGVPGSRWSSIAQTLEQLEGINTSDHSSNRQYASGKYSGHKGAYFGTGMEFETYLDPKHIDSPWREAGGCKIVKSHEWAHKLQTISEVFPTDWIMLVYRPDASSYAWWFEAGGFNIDYPDYSVYKNHAGMLGEITTQNDKMSDDLDNIERITRKQDEEIDDSPIQKRNKGRKFIINDDDF